MSTSTYTVIGMTCDHCIRSVREEIGQVNGVTEVNVDLQSRLVTVTSDRALDPAEIREAVEEAGYEVAR